MKTFDEYWKEHATDEFLSKEGVKILCADMNSELIDKCRYRKLASMRLTQYYRDKVELQQDTIGLMINTCNEAIAINKKLGKEIHVIKYIPNSLK